MSNQGYGRNPLWSPEYTGRKPSFNDMGAMQLNQHHPLNQGLVAWWLINEGAGSLFDILDRRRVISTAPTWSKGISGPQCQGFAISNASTSDLNFVDAPFTACVNILASGYPANYTDLFGRYTYSDESHNTGWNLQLRI